MEPVVVGVLALQGAFAKHLKMLNQLEVKAIEVRKPEDLTLCDALIIPGGESTTIYKQMNFIKFTEPFKKFSSQKPVFGTCAGLILMSHQILSDQIQPFNLLDIAVERNAFGRQSESFECEVNLQLTNAKWRPFNAVFIRAPRIRTVGSEVQVLASYEQEPILVRQGLHLGATFHPELTSDSAIHRYFLQLIKKR